MAPLTVTLWLNLPDSTVWFPLSPSFYKGINWTHFTLDPKNSYLPKAGKVGSAIAEIQTLTAELSPLPAGVLALSLWHRSSRHGGGCVISQRGISRGVWWSWHRLLLQKETDYQLILMPYARLNALTYYPECNV